MNQLASSPGGSRRPRRCGPLGRISRCVASAALLALFACTSVPNVEKVIRDPTDTARHLTIIGPRGPLPPARSEAILASLRSRFSHDGVLERHLAVEQAVAGSPLVVGNRTEILQDGKGTFQAIFHAIRGARKYLDLEYYILEDVESGGQRLSDLLVRKSRAGVAIHIIYDGFGSIGTPSSFFDRLRASGIKIVEYNPIDPLKAKNGYSPNNRDHRKILIADGTTAIVGGVNLSTTYESHSLRKLVGSDGPTAKYWRDTDVLIRGPAVTQLETLFLQHWTAHGGPRMAPGTVYAPVRSSGIQLVRIVGSNSGDTIPHFYATLLSAIVNAEKTIWLTTGYFVPTDEECEDLEAAARRGVDVRLLLPGTSDSPRALAIGRSNYSDLLEAGVKIYETRSEILHSKTAVIDSVWSVVGSSNFDHRSVLFNDEVDAVILGRETASMLETVFKDDMKGSHTIRLAQWRGRPFSERVDEAFSRVWQELF